MFTRQTLDDAAGERILVLDGAMGTEIAKFALTEKDFRGERFAAHRNNLLGCNDALNLTRPDVIMQIHERYLEAGADIIETCSFSATPIVLAEYGLADYAYEISRSAAALAVNAVSKFTSAGKPRFVAGVMGPMTKSAAVGSNIDDPAARDTDFDELEAAYYENARGLLDGGADIFMVETIFDTLNAKAASAAISRLTGERGIDMPVMFSAAVSDKAGRLLAGQTVEAFCVSLLHARPWSVGLNCSLGAREMEPLIAALSGIAPCLVSAHPNAGLPNEAGCYTESPEDTAARIAGFIDSGFVNIVGGCCGTTPEHIKAIAGVVKERGTPRRMPASSSRIFLSGLEPVEVPVPGENRILIIGERGNASGSPRFLRCLREGRFEDALALIRANIREGVCAVDISADDALIDGIQTITRLLNMAGSDPEIARVPFVIDTSDFTVMEAALKRVQGRCIANSVSLKDGEREFLRRDKRIRALGAIPMIMLFDENGQASTHARKVEIACRVYRLLTGSGVNGNEIFIDPNVLTIATGIEEHDVYARDFIESCSEITRLCPGVRLSAGVSNLSYSFRGNNALREAMHAVFLHHAGAAGLVLAMTSAGAPEFYGKLDSGLVETMDDLIFARRPDAAERVLKLALEGTGTDKKERAKETTAGKALSVRERLANAIVSGEDEGVRDIARSILDEGLSALQIVEGPLMDGMREVSGRFGAGQMFLPQVLRSARVMKLAVSVLEPFMPKDLSGTRARREKIVLATVKGDVHDIGKNIVGTVLACNGFEIIDLGVMVEKEKIIEAAESSGAVFIGLSGLVTPSLSEMCVVARALEERGLDIPLLIGGAAASLVHTALYIAPLYSAPVIYVADAGGAPEAARSLLSPKLRNGYLAKVLENYEEARIKHKKIENASVPPARKKNIDWKNYSPPQITPGITVLNGFDLEKAARHIDWDEFARRFDISPGGAAEKAREKLISDAKKSLSDIVRNRSMELRGVVGFFRALSRGDDLLLYGEDGKKTVFHFLRGERSGTGLCLSDFILPEEDACGRFDIAGLFAFGAVFITENRHDDLVTNNGDYGALLFAALADSLAEARSSLAACEPFFPGAPLPSIRPAFGYSCVPDHEDKRAAFGLLDAERNCGFALTSSAMIVPASSVCGLYIFHTEAVYFSTGILSDEETRAWAARKNISEGEARRRLGRP